MWVRPLLVTWVTMFHLTDTRRPLGGTLVSHSRGRSEWLVPRLLDQSRPDSPAPCLPQLHVGSREGLPRLVTPTTHPPRDLIREVLRQVVLVPTGVRRDHRRTSRSEGSAPPTPGEEGERDDRREERQSEEGQKENRDFFKSWCPPADFGG